MTQVVVMDGEMALTAVVIFFLYREIGQSVLFNKTGKTGAKERERR